MLGACQRQTFAQNDFPEGAIPPDSSAKPGPKTESPSRMFTRLPALDPLQLGCRARALSLPAKTLTIATSANIAEIPTGCPALVGPVVRTSSRWRSVAGQASDHWGNTRNRLRDVFHCRISVANVAAGPAAEMAHSDVLQTAGFACQTEKHQGPVNGQAALAGSQGQREKGWQAFDGTLAKGHPGPS